MALTRLVNDYKDSVRASSTGANINLGAAPNTLDGVNLSLNDRVLVKDQTPSSLNGIYRVTTLGTGSNGSWIRSSDFNDWREVTAGVMVFVELGAINGNAFYFINGAEPNVTIDTTAINFSNLYSVNGNVTSFPGNVNIAGTLNVVGNIVSQSYETITLTEYANSLSVTGNITLSNNANINVGAGGNIYMGSTALPRFRTGNTAPVSPNLGDTWYQGNTDILYEYIQDANNNKYWLDLTSNPSSYGNLTVANTLTINGNLSASVSSMNITGGSLGYVLRTDGNGNLSWVAVSATAGGSNTYVQFSDGGSIGGATYLQYNKTTGNLYSTSTTTSISNTTGAITAASLGISGNINANAYYSNYYLYSNGNPITTPAGGSNTMVQFNNSGTFTGATYLQYNLTSGNLVSNSTTTSTSTTTGAFVIGGGVGIGGNLYVGGNLSVGGNTTFINAQTITTTDTIAAPAINAGTIGNTGATLTGGSINVTGAVQGNTHTGSAIYAGTIGNTGATFTGSTLTLSSFAQATNFYDLTGNYNVYLGSGGTAGRGIVAGYSGGNYGALGYNITFTNTTGVYNKPIGDQTTMLRFDSGGMNLYSNSNTTAQNSLVMSQILGINNTGVTTHYGAVVPQANNSITLGSTSAYWSTCYAVTFSGTSTTAKYADLAEMYHADDYYAPGTVMVFGGDLDVTISKVSHDTRIAGVVSTNPAYLMNDNFEQDNWVPVALTGRVPCNVQGPIQKGDLLVSSDKPGVAIKLDKSLYEVGCVIGKSLDIISDTSVRKIEIAVGRY